MYIPPIGINHLSIFHRSHVNHDKVLICEIKILIPHKNKVVAKSFYFSYLNIQPIFKTLKINKENDFSIFSIKNSFKCVLILKYHNVYKL